MNDDDSIPARLKRLRVRSGLSMARMAKALGLKTASGYQRYEDPELFTKNELPLHIATAAADAMVGLGFPPIERSEVLMLAGIDELTLPQLKKLDDQTWIFCVGEAAAGTWREAFEWPRDEWIPLAISFRDERYAGARRAALRIRGDSMDQLYPDGSYIVFVRFDEIGKRPAPGERVVVIRQRQDLVEATVKELKRDASGQRWLIPRSSNPAHQAIRIEVGGDGETIEIMGLVVGSQRLE